MKNKKETFQASPPIHVAVPNTSAEKLKAITNLTEAILILSRALDGVNTQVNISHVNIMGPLDHDGIRIEHEPGIK